MKCSFKLANKIRTKLLLFIDEEIRKKANNISLNKTEDNYNLICKIKTQEESFSNNKEDNILYFNKIDYLNSPSKLLLSNYYKFRTKMKTRISYKFQSPKNIIEDLKNNDIYSKDKKHFYKSHECQIINISLNKVNKNKKLKPKEYLKFLCRNFIKKSGLDKYYQSNSKIPRKAKISSKSPKLKQFEKNIEKRKTVKQKSNNINSFKIILFACDY